MQEPTRTKQQHCDQRSIQEVCSRRSRKAGEAPAPFQRQFQGLTLLLPRLKFTQTDEIFMADNIPNVPAGAVPPKKETGKVQPKKETVRINLPPKPSAAPTIKLPTLPPGGPSAAAASAPTIGVAAPAAAPAAPRPGGAAPISSAPRPVAAAPRPAPVMAHIPTLSPLDTALAIAAAVIGLLAVGTTVWMMQL